MIDLIVLKLSRGQVLETDGRTDETHDNTPRAEAAEGWAEVAEGQKENVLEFTDILHKENITKTYRRIAQREYNSALVLTCTMVKFHSPLY